MVEQIRSSNDAWHRRDLEATLAPYADEIEWNTTEDGKILRARNFTSLDAAMESLAGAGLTRIWKPPGD